MNIANSIHRHHTQSREWRGNLGNLSLCHRSKSARWDVRSHKIIELLNTRAGKAVEEQTAAEGGEMTCSRSQGNHHHFSPLVTWMEIVFFWPWKKKKKRASTLCISKSHAICSQSIAQQRKCGFTELASYFIYCFSCNWVRLGANSGQALRRQREAPSF